MNRTGIEWVKNPDGSQGYTLNSKTGCTNHTPEGLCLGGLFPCYAFKLAHGRLWKGYTANPNLAEVWGNKLVFDKANREAEYDQHDTDPFYPRFWAERLEQPSQIKKPVGIFLDDMSDWMGDCWPKLCTERELAVMRENPQHRFYTLTKQPQNLPQFSPFPDNCWVGVTATNAQMLREGLMHLEEIQATIKFVSLEPLLSRIYDPLQFLNALPDFLSVIDWLIPGACTGTLPEMVRLVDRYPPETLSVARYGNKFTAQPPIEWVREIVEAADKAGVKVFLKDNLKPLLWHETERVLIPDWARMAGEYDGLGGFLLRQEMPIDGV